MQTRRLLGVLIIGALALGACSGSDSKATPKRTTTTTTRPGSSTSTTKPNDTTPVLQRLTALPNAHFAIEYEPGSGIGTTATFWNARRGRIDTTYQGAPYRLYSDANTGTTTACVKSGARWNCKPAQPATDPAVPPVVNPPLMLGVLSRLVRTPGVTTSTRTIAGQPAECLTLPTAPNVAVQEFCLAESGALLSAKGTLGGKDFDLTASSYSPVVSTGDLDPPA